MLVTNAKMLSTMVETIISWLIVYKVYILNSLSWEDLKEAA